MLVGVAKFNLQVMESLPLMAIKCLCLLVCLRVSVLSQWFVSVVPTNGCRFKLLSTVRHSAVFEFTYIFLLQLEALAVLDVNCIQSTAASQWKKISVV